MQVNRISLINLLASNILINNNIGKCPQIFWQLENVILKYRQLSNILKRQNVLHYGNESLHKRKISLIEKRSFFCFLFMGLVDVLTPSGLPPKFRAKVLAEAQPV
jgi:hypothetical protein